MITPFRFTNWIQRSHLPLSGWQRTCTFFRALATTPLRKKNARKEPLEIGKKKGGDPGTSPEKNLLPEKPIDSPPITLVLDLDETLVKSSECDPYNYDILLPVHIDGMDVEVYTKKRPSLDSFLNAVKKEFEVIVFTSAHRAYAEPLLDILDPNKEIIRHRLYREDCSKFRGVRVKDLSLLGRDLASTIIVEDNLGAFHLQVDNGIMVSAWEGKTEDKELNSVLEVLQEAKAYHHEHGDVRPFLREKFRLYERVSKEVDYRY